MNTPISLALLAVGVVLLVFGISSVDSFGSHVSKFFTGHPTDKAMWLVIAGVVAAILGVVGLARGRKA